jgi:hypothetical protein
MLTKVISSSKNFLTCVNLLYYGVFGTVGLQGRSAKVLLLLTPRW